jgi:hypothetical protein
MRALFVVLAPMLMIAGPARAEAPKLAVFDFELVDTSLEGEIKGPRADEHERLLRVGDQLRRELGDSGKFQIVDIGPEKAEAQGSNLQACGGCDISYAKKLGADLVMTGVVQKVSNLILNISVYLRDVHTGGQVTAMSTDMRGNTDESWTRATSYLVHERLLAPNYGRPAP